MLNPNEISAVHLPSMQNALMHQRSKLDEHVVAKLYKTARSLLHDPKELEKVDANVWKSRVAIQEPSVVLSSCTDVNTGLFVQLVGQPGAKDDSLLLTFGIKFCQESMDKLRGHRATKIW